MKTLRLRELEKIQGGESNELCLAEAGLSFTVGCMLLGPIGGFIGAYSALLYSDNCN